MLSSRAKRGICSSLLVLAACSPESLVKVDPPSGAVDPNTINTAAAAKALYANAVGRFAMCYGGMTPSPGRNQIMFAGFLTDELVTANLINTNSPPNVDERTLTVPAAANGLGSDVGGLFYGFIHSTRISAQQGREALQRYAPPPSAPLAWQGQLYALEAYTILWLAEMYCSGIPLTSVPLEGSVAPTRGFTTQELFERAVTLFDSAIALTADSARFLNLARVGKGRALLGLGRHADAATAVAQVPTYGSLFPSNTFFGAGNLLGTNPRTAQVQNNEGTNGLNWLPDPRAVIRTTPALSGAMQVSGKYSITAAGTIDATLAFPSNPIRLADGLEARLTEAEADLAAGGTTWLTTLNTLRSTCVGTAACAPVPGLTAAALPPLVDPGSPATRLDMLMRERAMWLFLTGHRQGDLRRMARVYSRAPNTLWPTGTYSNPGFAPNIAAAATHGIAYGTDVVLLPSTDEQTFNPLYGGCYDRNP
jgi:hypothetical protein